MSKDKPRTRPEMPAPTGISLLAAREKAAYERAITASGGSRGERRRARRRNRRIARRGGDDSGLLLRGQREQREAYEKAMSDLGYKDVDEGTGYVWQEDQNAAENNPLGFEAAWKTYNSWGQSADNRKAYYDYRYGNDRDLGTERARMAARGVAEGGDVWNERLDKVTSQRTDYMADYNKEMSDLEASASHKTLSGYSGFQESGQSIGEFYGALYGHEEQRNPYMTSETDEQAATRRSKAFASGQTAESAAAMEQNLKDNPWVS